MFRFPSHQLHKKMVNSPGHNHFWILDDVINNGFWCGLQGNSLGTLSSDDEADDDDGLYRVETGTE